MRENLAAPFSLKDAAEQTFYSSYHFHRLFREATGVPLAQFLAALRMQKAKELLAFTDRPAWDIASTVGYQSAATFSTQFSRLTGMAPSQFREVAEWVGDMSIGETIEYLPVVQAPHIPVAPSLTGSLATENGYVYIVGFFPEPIPRGIPQTFTLLDPSGVCRMEGGQVEAQHRGLGMAVPVGTRLIDITTGHDEILVAGPVEPSEIGNPTVVRFRKKDLGDPPLLSAVPLTYLAPGNGKGLGRKTTASNAHGGRPGVGERKTH
jgi:AraC-like DNA-binding protein